MESESEEEIVDILEVVYAICDFKNVNKQTLEARRKEKAKMRGGFKHKIILDEVK